MYGWSVFADQNPFLTEEYNFEATTTGCWHHPKFQGQVPKEAGYVCARKDQGGCICNTDCQRCGYNCGYSRLQETWKEVTNLTLKNCFEKWGIKRDSELVEVEEYDDLEFEALCKGIYYGYIYCRIRQFRRKCSSV